MLGARKRLSMGYCTYLTALRELLKDLPVIFHQPILFAGVALEVVMFPFVSLILIGSYGFGYATIFFVVFDSPLIYVFAREVWRQLHMLPESEAFEISPERWVKTFTEYVNDVKDKQE